MDNDGTHNDVPYRTQSINLSMKYTVFLSVEDRNPDLKKIRYGSGLNFDTDPSESKLKGIQYPKKYFTI